jgi:iron(III) transport system substrate-binding protein
VAAVAASLGALAPSGHAHAQGAGAALTEIAALSGPDREEKLIAGARREGVVNVYTSETIEDLAALSSAFQGKYGVKLNIWRASSEDVLQRGAVEAHGGRFDADAFETGAGAMESLHREQLLQPIAAPSSAALAPAALRPHGEWIGTRYNIFVAAYNTAAVAKTDLPQSYADLAAPRWKGKLGIEADDSDWFGAVMDAMGEEQGLAIFRNIVAANGISVRKGHTLLANLVVSGEVPLALSTYLYKAEQLKKRGAPVDWLTIAPVIARFEGIGIARRAPHPYGAALFADFMLTDAQRILATRDFLPADIKVRPMPEGLALTFLDPAKALDQSQKWSRNYRDIVTHKAR